MTAARPRPALALVWLGLVLGLAGCDGCSCEQDRMVTFGLDAGPRPGQSAPVASVPALGGTDGGAGAWVPTPARALPAGTRRVELSGHALELSDGDLRAILLVDVDGDGDQDAYVLHTRGAAAAPAAGAPARTPGSAPTQLVLSLARVGPSGAALSELGQLSAPAECSLSTPRGETLARSLVSLGADYACPTGPASLTLIATLEAQPRLAERLTLLAPAASGDGASGAPEASGSPASATTGALTADALPLSVVLRAEDRNTDGAADLVARVMLGTEGDHVSVELLWLNSASGLSRDRAEPEATLRTLANAAADPLTRQPEVALRGADRVLALYTALCSEGGAARVQLGDVRGLPCGRSRGAGKAAAVVAAAHAQAGDVFEAAAALARLEDPGLTLSDAERRMVTRALGRAPGPRGLSMRKLADVTARAGLDFVDEHHVQLPGGRVVSLRESPPTPTPGGATMAPSQPEGPAAPAAPASPAPTASSSAPEDGGVPAPQGNTTDTPAASNLPPPRANAGIIVDPSGRFRVQRLGRGCASHVVELTALDPILHGPPRVAAIEPLASPSCRGDTQPSLEVADDGGFAALGWAPQGLLLARGAELWVVPLTDEARPAGAPFQVASGSLPPAPVNGPAIARDGTRYLTALDFGLVLHTLGPEPSVTLLRPAGWAELPSDAPVRGLALSPAGNAAVVQRGSAVYFLTW